MVDFSKPVQTRDGRPVRILCTDRKKTEQPVVGLIGYLDGTEIPHTWSHEGNFLVTNQECETDLVNAPPKMRKIKVEVRLLEDSGRLVAVAYAEGEPGSFSTDIREWVAYASIEMEVPES